MRKSILIISLLLIILTFTAYGQDKPFSLGVRAGMNLSSMHISASANSDVRLGYHMGIAAQCNLFESFFVESGLYYSVKPTKTVLSDQEEDLVYGSKYFSVENKTNSGYLQMPLSLGYKLKLNNDFSFYCSLGGYFAYGVSGESKSYGLYYEDDRGMELWSPKTRKRSAFDKNLFKRFDTGGLFIIGVEYKKMVLNLNYELGLINLSRIKVNKPNIFTGAKSDEMIKFSHKYYNRNIVLSLGYRIF